MKLTKKHAILAAILVFAASIIPLFMICRYTLPFYDDYNYGRLTAEAWRTQHSLFAMLKAAFQQAGITYQNWQGSYAGVVVMAMSPGVVKESLYPVGTAGVLLLLIGCTLYFSNVLFHHLMKLDRSSALLSALILLFGMLQFMPSPSEGIFWYNSASYYTGFFALTLLLFALLLNERFSKRSGWRYFQATAAIILAVCIGGSNFISGLTACLALALLVAYRFFVKHDKWRFPVIIFAVLAVAFLVNVAAPGNRLRQEYFEHVSPVAAVFQSIYEATKFIASSFSLPVVCLFALLLPLLYPAAQRTSFSYKYPAFVTVVTFLVYASSFTPAIYATGHNGPGRAMNLSFFMALWMTALNLFYWCGWIGKQIKADDEERFFTAKGASTLPLLLVCLFLIGSIGLAGNNENSITSVSAVQSLCSGEARTFYDEGVAHLNQLRNPELQNCVLQAYSVKPYLLYKGNLSTDATQSANRYTAHYYGKESVVGTG